MRTPHRVLLERLAKRFLLLLVRLDQRISVLDRNTHLEQILVEDLVIDLVLGSLREQEFDERDADFGLLGVKLLVAAQLDQLLVVVRVTGDLLGHLCKHQLQLDRTDTVQD